MPGVANYIPAQQAKFDQWLANFSQQISANAPAYGLSNSDAATIARLASQWSAAYQPVTSPGTKTKPAVAAKDTARVMVTAQIRTYAQAIANNPGVSAASKIVLRLNPRTSPWTPITAPLSRPQLSFQSATPLSATLRYCDSDDGVSTKAKPFGVVQCQVFGQTSPTPITDRSSLPLIATPTKSPFMLSFTDAQAGQKFYLAARWATRTGLTGPWSSTINFIVTA